MYIAKRVALCIGLAVMCSQASSAINFISFEQITVAGTAVGFTATKTAGSGSMQAITARCRVRTAELSYTTDGTTPTSTVGTLLEIGDILTVVDHEVMNRFLVIRTGSSGQLDCTYTNP